MVNGSIEAWRLEKTLFHGDFLICLTGLHVTVIAHNSNVERSLIDIMKRYAVSSGFAVGSKKVELGKAGKCVWRSCQ